MIKEDGTVVFEGAEQEKLNQIVEERLARERGKYTDYDDIKGIAEELKAFGYEGTPAEIRAAVRQQREEVQKQKELEELQQQAQDEGTSPELLAEIRGLKKELSEIKSEKEKVTMAQAEAAERQAAWNKQYNEFKEAYPDVDDNTLAEDARFKKFAKGKALPLKELYEDFIEFIGEAEAASYAKVESKRERSTSSGKGGNSDGNSYGLTSRQQDLAKSNGMSYKEYAELLKNVQ